MKMTKSDPGDYGNIQRRRTTSFGSVSRLNLETFFEQQTTKTKRPSVQVIMLAKQLQIQSAVQTQNDVLDDNKSVTDISKLRASREYVNTSQNNDYQEDEAPNPLGLSNKFFSNLMQDAQDSP